MIAVVGDDDDVAATLADAGETVRDDADGVADAELVVAVGDDALLDVTERSPAAPVLAVGTDRAVSTVPRHPDAVAAAVEEFRDGHADVVERTVLSVAVADRRYRALFDAMLVTADPAQISGYRVETAADGVLDEVRADGVVVATPAGSRGYARDAGGPTLAPATDALAVVPVAPFTVDPHQWVVAPPLSLTVTRDESPVALRVDGRERGVVAPDDPVRIDRDGAISVVNPERLATMEKT